MALGTEANQVDLVDLHSNEYEGMKWLLTYCDHDTKFVATCPLLNKHVKCSSLVLYELMNELTLKYIVHAPTIAKALLDVFKFIGQPAFL